MMIFVFAILVTLFSTVSGRNRYITKSLCDSRFTLSSDETFDLTYLGDTDIKDPCKIRFNSGDFTDQTCVKITSMGDPCNVEVEYHAGIFTSISDRNIYCDTSSRYDEYCTSLSGLYIVLKNPSWILSQDSPMTVKVYSKDKFSNDISVAVPEMVKTSVYIIIFVIVGCVVLLLVTVCVIIICCCRRRQGSAGYRNPQMAAATTTTQASYQPVTVTQYPPQNVPQQPPYQPPPAGYQPPQVGYQPPQAGYQPPQAGYNPPHPGYPPQPAGYPPAPQQGYAAYQTSSQSQPAPTPEKSPMASAPPMSEMYPMQEMAPPPYPGK